MYELTRDRGADHILETVGCHHLARSIEAAAVGGHISLIAILDGYEISGPSPTWGARSCASTACRPGIGGRWRASSARPITSRSAP
ncbi:MULTISPECIES: hypothetical protein [Amycolatopsis]|uniref:Uncharacterized protein n=1 Tax=Amycolatopsis thermalba TaxID=944492 RepID=A0ABY4NXY4_9PSEU|nr:MULTISPECIES: hypothetical protein [Amycolatopsis]UQS24941.1 hypothetical protein L1857_20050 [Amycolatopsis thermalba]